MIKRMIVIIWLALIVGSLTQAQTHSNEAIEVHADVPELPFADNPDPNLCGIPEPWNSDEPAWLSGYYEGELIQPVVFLYDSHLRRKITGEVPTGTEVRILLFQNNPSLNYYLVRTFGDNSQEGWVPEPFLRFEPND